MEKRKETGTGGRGARAGAKMVVGRSPTKTELNTRFLKAPITEKAGGRLKNRHLKRGLAGVLGG